MITQHDVENAAKLLRVNSQLAELSAYPPGAMQMPFQRSKTDVYLAIAIALPATRISLHNLWLATNAALSALLEVPLLHELKALDVLLFAAKGDAADRVLRVSIYQSAFAHAKLDSPADLLLRSPAEGVTCGWYWEKDKVPVEEVPAQSQKVAV